ncbi:MAG TPA: hypothetical protein VK669_10445 [Candidatus Limnocylindrales bacterium]|nr:hypothetical protein [Candidatus Limnocylindrales bacterium]
MQQTTGVALVATHLPYTDRRALSQAWYSALHLAGRDAPGARARSSPVHGFLRAPLARAVRRGDVPARDTGTGRNAFRGRTVAAPIVARRDGGAGPLERRCAKSELARTIERGIARRAPCAQTASFVVRAANGRVHLVVRTGGGGTRVVAVCAPPLRERVERALAQARFALAGCGLRAEAA